MHEIHASAPGSSSLHHSPPPSACRSPSRSTTKSVTKSITKRSTKSIATSATTRRAPSRRGTSAISPATIRRTPWSCTAPGARDGSRRSIRWGAHPWRHWEHPEFARPVYYWNWGEVHNVSCTAEDSYGDQYPVSVSTWSGFGLQQHELRRGRRARPLLRGDAAATRAATSPPARTSNYLFVAKLDRARRAVLRGFVHLAVERQRQIRVGGDGELDLAVVADAEDVGRLADAHRVA